MLTQCVLVVQRHVRMTQAHGLHAQWSSYFVSTVARISGLEFRGEGMTRCPTGAVIMHL